MSSNRPRSRWPEGHGAWAFANAGELEASAVRFFTAGTGRLERLLFVADDPVPRRWPTQMLTSRRLVVASTREVYGADRTVESASPLANFEGILAEAEHDGYDGLRVLADTTSLVEGSEAQVRAWMDWEHTADAFMASNPVTGLCAFDRSRLDAALVDRLLDAHEHTADALVR